ncbi:hypothetical protein [Ammoniphilus sp. YIM 78166]|nr:hypothetical protein [Ammoniphilus sp. YIM 78166]
MLVAFSIWLFTILFSIGFGTFLCYRIEKKGVKRWGATGKLFKS